MSTNLRIESISRSLLAIFFVGCGLVACTTQAAKSDAGGGKGGGAGTTTGAGGSTTADAGYLTNDGVTCPLPVALIADFAPRAADGGAPANEVRFGGDATTFAGGGYFYPNDPTTNPAALMQDVTGGNWHLTGTVGDFSGFGLYFDNCSRVNASAFRGISFTISGTVQGGSLTFEVDTLNDTIAPTWIIAHPAGGATPPAATDPGRCIPAAGAANQYAQSDCAEPTKAITVTSAATPQTVLWGDLTGKPDPGGVVPGDILGIRWIIPTPAANGALDLVIDDLKFVQ